MLKEWIDAGMSQPLKHVLLSVDEGVMKAVLPLAYKGILIIV